MPHHNEQVCVKKVTVEYAFKGERFSVEFQPMKIMSIVFSKIELDRINEKLRIENKLPAKEPFDASVAIQDQGLDHVSGATSKRIGPDVINDGPPLWWRTDGNTWFHPGDLD